MVKALKTVTASQTKTRAKNGTKKSKTMSATEQEFASALQNELPVTISTALEAKREPVSKEGRVSMKAAEQAVKTYKTASSAAKKTPAIKSTEPIRNIRAFCSTYVRNLRRDQFGNPMTAIAAAFERAIQA